MKRRIKLVPPIETVRLKVLAAADGKAYVGMELDYHTPEGEATRLELGLDTADAAALGAHLARARPAHAADCRRHICVRQRALVPLLPAPFGSAAVSPSPAGLSSR